MWPKVFAQLVDLLPHVSRLIPMADVFFATKTANEKANEATLATLAQEVRTDLSRVTSAHDSLYRQLQEQSGQIAAIAGDFHQANTAMERTALQSAALERQLKSMRGWLIAVVILLALVFSGIIALLLRAH